MRKINDTFVQPTRSPGFGDVQHVRSYVLDRSFVRDARTGLESSDPRSVLDGDIDDFLRASLAMRIV